MGIQGLLPFLANSTREAHISEFENQYVAVDAYCWLHKGIYSCSYELAMKKPTTKYVTYCMRYIEMLRHFKVKPVLVFDGRNLSSKKETEKKRREERARKYKKGLELIRAGKTSEGRQLLGESVDVGHELVLNLMKECRQMNVDCIVAPFEADAQLSYLNLNKIVACIITEDSDLLVYGCERVMFKMDKSGRGRLIEKNNIFMSLGMEAEEYSEDKFRHMCILSGCDYLPSLPSVGPATALKFIKLICDKDILEALPRLPVILNKTKITVSSEYIDGFKIADNTFKHQLVYDPFERKQVPLKPTVHDGEIIGDKLPDDEAFQLAIGNIDPITMKILGDFDPDKNGRGFDILWRTSTTTNRKESGWNSNSQTPNGKRQSEVTLVRHDIKKYCTPQNLIKFSNTQRRQSAPEIPRSGFLFEVKKQKPFEGSNLLKSRYFGLVKKKRQEIKPKNAIDEGKRKDESYEEYLQRMYEEEQSSDENDTCNKNNSDSCHSDDGLLRNLSCKSLDLKSSPEQLSEQIKESQTHREKAEKVTNVVRHSLLDEISKVEGSRMCEGSTAASIPNENIESEVSDNFEQQIDRLMKDLLPVQDLSLNSPAQSSNDGDSNSETNANEDGANMREATLSQGSTSPVFKVRTRRNFREESFRSEEAIDTAGTPTSPYFSSPSSSRTAILDKTPLASRKSSKTTSGLKSNKTICKNQSHKTLFQFGFRKENKEIVDAT